MRAAADKVAQQKQKAMVGTLAVARNSMTRSESSAATFIPPNSLVGRALMAKHEQEEEDVDTAVDAFDHRMLGRRGAKGAKGAGAPKEEDEEEERRPMKRRGAKKSASTDALVTKASQGGVLDREERKELARARADEGMERRQKELQELEQKRRDERRARSGL